MVIMSNKKCQCQPAVYGQLRAEYLKRLTKTYIAGNVMPNEEMQRQKLLKEIREGKLRK
jgi:hypothetical protein